MAYNLPLNQVVNISLRIFINYNFTNYIRINIAFPASKKKLNIKNVQNFYFKQQFEIQGFYFRCVKNPGIQRDYNELVKTMDKSNAHGTRGH